MAQSNSSVARVKAMLKAMPAQLRTDMRAAVFAEANKIADTQRILVPKGETLNLLNSIRVEEGAHALQAVVKAGGKLTTKKIRKVSLRKTLLLELSGLGVPDYDYARAIEFGTVEHVAEPFFYGPYRKSKVAVRRRMKAKAKASMKKVAPVE